MHLRDLSKGVVYGVSLVAYGIREGLGLGHAEHQTVCKRLEVVTIGGAPARRRAAGGAELLIGGGRLHRGR